MSPMECQLLQGTPKETLEACQIDLEYAAIPYIQAVYGEAVYVSGMDCLTVSFLEEPA